MNLILVIFNRGIIDEKSVFENLTRRSTEEKFNLLIVDDNIQNLAFLNKELKSSYQIYKSSNSSEAFKLLAIQAIDLILIRNNNKDFDCNLFCNEIKSSSIFHHIPIILLSEKGSIKDKIERLKSGFDAFVEQPFTVDYLKAQIQNILDNRIILTKHFSNNSDKINTHNKETVHQLIKKIYTIIEESISDSSFTVDQLAKLMNMSRATLYRKVKEYSSLKPNEMILYSKLQIASKFLMKRIYTVSQVASMVGYSSQSNFSRDFRKHFGINPSLYAANISVGMKLLT